MDLNYDSLRETLGLSNGSERGETQRQAESQLHNWEILPGYHLLLQEVYLNEKESLQTRWLAVICLKNGVNKYWRSSKENCIRPEEKAQIRDRLFNMVHERNKQLTSQNAYAVARIVRFDFPDKFPQLFEVLAQKLEVFIFEECNWVCANNLLIILKEIFKAISLVRIGKSRQALHSKATVLVPLLIKAYYDVFEEWTKNLDLVLMEVCYLCLKNLRKVILECFDRPHSNDMIVCFIHATVVHFQLLVMQHDKYSSDLLERYVKSYGKFYMRMIDSSPTSFLLLPFSGDIISLYLSLLEKKAPEIYSNDGEKDFWETLALQGFSILKKIITYIHKNGVLSLKQNDNKEEIKFALSKLTQELFTPQVIQHLSDLVINWYLKLRPSDLESWIIEPEEWCVEDMSSSWEFQVRPCAENFFQDLIKYFKDYLLEFVLGKISTELLGTGYDILSKDAILCAFQLSALSIADMVDFDELLQKILIPEALNYDFSENKILRRRVCLIVEEWVSVKCALSSRRVVYDFLSQTMQNVNKKDDLVVRLTALNTLKIIVDDWDFEKKDFQPFLNSFIGSSIGMLHETSLTESKVRVLSTLSVCIARCNSLVDESILVPLILIVPQYWNEDGDENTLLKNTILRLLKHLVASLNDRSVATYSIIIPLIEHCCSPNCDKFGLISEDGYELWLSLLQNAPSTESTNVNLSRLFGLVEHGLISSTEILPVILSIMRSYALLIPSLYLDTQSLNLFRILAGYISSTRDDSYSVFIALIEILILQGRSRLDMDLLVNILIGSSLFESILKYCLDENQTITSTMKVFLLLSRLAMNSNGGFIEILNQLPVDSSVIFDTWIENYSHNGNPRNKKINLLALLSLSAYSATNNISYLASKIPEIIRLVLLYLEEVNEASDGSCESYKLDFAYEDLYDYCYLDPEAKPPCESVRYEELLTKEDPVFNINLEHYLIEALRHLQTSLSDRDFQNILTMNDEYYLEKLKSYLGR